MTNNISWSSYFALYLKGACHTLKIIVTCLVMAPAGGICDPSGTCSNSDQFLYVFKFSRCLYHVVSQISVPGMVSMLVLPLITPTCRILKLCLTYTTSEMIRDRSSNLRRYVLMKKQIKPCSLLSDQLHAFESSHEKTCLCHMRTTKVQISLRIHAVCSAPSLFAALIV